MYLPMQAQVDDYLNPPDRAIVQRFLGSKSVEFKLPDYVFRIAASDVADPNRKDLYPPIRPIYPPGIEDFGFWLVLGGCGPVFGRFGTGFGRFLAGLGPMLADFVPESKISDPRGGYKRTWLLHNANAFFTGQQHLF